MNYKKTCIYCGKEISYGLMCKDCFHEAKYELEEYLAYQKEKFLEKQNSQLQT